jgi:hypothetical protein
VGCEQPGHGADRRLVLEVDGEPRHREGGHRLAQRRDPVGAVHAQAAYVGEVEVRDPAGVTGDPPQRRVVEAHHVSVAGRLHVGLEVREAERGRPAEGGEGVLGGECHATADGGWTAAGLRAPSPPQGPWEAGDRGLGGS